MEQYVTFYGKNNPFVINVEHAFKNFLQKCDYMEPLPEGITWFTGMMAPIIRDIYGVDIDEITQLAQEMLGEANPVEVAKPSTSQSKPVLDNEELKELARGILKKKRAKESVAG